MRLFDLYIIYSKIIIIHTPTHTLVYTHTHTYIYYYSSLVI